MQYVTYIDTALSCTPRHSRFFAEFYMGIFLLGWFAIPDIICAILSVNCCLTSVTWQMLVIFNM